MKARRISIPGLTERGKEILRASEPGKAKLGGSTGPHTYMGRDMPESRA
ncbi:MAG TPA: hypothetical protein VH186_11370 [Chloroflexia bacterium]|nr:hypothetical protein [Chloroflexia bacterium]